MSLLVEMVILPLLIKKKKAHKNKSARLQYTELHLGA